MNFKFEAFSFGAQKPKIEWFPKLDGNHLKFTSIEVIGYELRKVKKVYTLNSRGQVINTARSVGTDKVNAQGIRESFLTKGICTSQLPPVILETGELIDGFTRNSVLLDLDQEWFVYLAVRLLPGFTLEDAKDELGLGFNDHLQQKPARIEDFKKRLAQWIKRQENIPTRDACLAWFGAINHSFTQKRVTTAVDDVIKHLNASDYMESFTKVKAVKAAKDLLKVNNVVSFDNKSGASIARAYIDILDAYMETGEKPVCVGFLNGVEAQDAKKARKSLLDRAEYYNSAFTGIVRDYNKAVKEKKPYKFCEVVGFLPQIIDVEDGIVDC